MHISNIGLHEHVTMLIKSQSLSLLYDDIFDKNAHQ